MPQWRPEPRRWPITAPSASSKTTFFHTQQGRLKLRTLYLVGRTRLHLDEVQGLGAWLELEVVLQEGEPEELGVQEAHALMARLGVSPEDLVEGAYVDLLAHRAVTSASN